MVKVFSLCNTYSLIFQILAVTIGIVCIGVVHILHNQPRARGEAREVKNM